MWDSWAFFASFLPVAACIAVIICVMPAIKLARVLGVIDQPGGRKQHDRAVPPIGGLVVFPIFMVLALVAGADLHSYWSLYVGLIVLLVTGAIDDRHGLNAWLKFWIQVGVAVLVSVFGGASVQHLGKLGIGFNDDILWTGWAAWPFTIAAVVLLINAVNLMDGLDGLASGMSAVMLGWMIVAAIVGGDVGQALVVGVLVGALCGFLVFNMRNPWRRKASVFLGDAGSMCLGLALGWFAIHLAQWPGMPLAPVSVAWIIALPVFDACAQFYRRVREGRHPFSPDRGHFHHHFINAGLSVRVTTPIILGLVFVMGGFGYLGVVAGVPELLMLVLWGGALLAHMAISYRPARYVRLISTLVGRQVFAVDGEGKAEGKSVDRDVSSSSDRGDKLPKQDAA